MSTTLESQPVSTTKLDFVKEFPELYRPPRDVPALVFVPEMTFLMIDGRGDPGTSKEFEGAIKALYSVSYGAKFLIKRAPQGIDYKIPPLEGLWWGDDMAVFHEAGRREEWRWTLMIPQPPFVDASIIDAAITQARRKQGGPALEALRFESFEEGLCVQVLHLGPYTEEGPTVVALHAFIEQRGLTPRGKHHEIYLGDPRRSAPQRLRTIIRQPVA